MVLGILILGDRENRKRWGFHLEEPKNACDAISSESEIARHW
jgi:hypothetical protein